ncbi:uncharacterized protein LOC135817263 isoform X1 [Sycon ciliatum]|uniref:uncharacterized protein LOC135817263 isoform X1 n=1 Tax=Sycon ciliatum TaxID=27933 RepID=UPI0031F6C23A
MSNQHFLSKTIVMPTSSMTSVENIGSTSGDSSVVAGAGAAGGRPASVPSMPTRRERRMRATSASSGLADVEAKKKKKGWAPIRKMKRFFSRGEDLDEARAPGELADHAFNHGNVVKYKPGPDSLHSGRNRHHVHGHSASAPVPMSPSDLQRVRTESNGGTATAPASPSATNAGAAGQFNIPDGRFFRHSPSIDRAQQFYSSSEQVSSSAEATCNTPTEDRRGSANGEADSAPHSPTKQKTTLKFSKTAAQQTQGKSASNKILNEDLGDLPIRLTVKRITKLKDRNEDPTVNARDVVVAKGQTGLGMTLAGSNPVIVIKVEHDCPAEQAGILVGDMIVAVADIDVRSSTQAHVNRMITLASKSSSQPAASSEDIADDVWNRVQSMQDRLDGGAAVPSTTLESAAVKSTPATRQAGHTDMVSSTDNTPAPIPVRAAPATAVEPRRSRRVSLDLTSDVELSDSTSKSATPDSVKSFGSPRTVAAATESLPGGQTVQEASPQDANTSSVDTPTSVSAKTSGSPARFKKNQDNGSGAGLGVLIRQKSRKLRAQRISTGMVDESSVLPISLETDEDQEILDLINNRHSLLLTEAVERCHRDRLDEKQVDEYISEGEGESDGHDASSGCTPRSGFSTPGSEDGVVDSKSAPTTPTTRRRVKVRRSESHKGSAVIVKQKSGRVLAAPRPRPSILPGDIAARLVDPKRKANPHVDSGYASIHQDDLDTDNLEQALVAADVKLSGNAHSPVHGDNAERDNLAHTTVVGGAELSAQQSAPLTAKRDTLIPDKHGAPEAVKLSPGRTTGPSSVFPRSVAQAGKPGVRRTKSMLVTGNAQSPSAAAAAAAYRGGKKTSVDTMSTPPWKLELQRQREEKERELGDKLAGLPASNTPPAVAKPGLKRMNSAKMVASAAARKEAVVAREEKSTTPAIEAPSWVAMAKDKSKRASVHDTVSTGETSVQAPADTKAKAMTLGHQKGPASTSQPAHFTLQPKSKAHSTSALPGMHKRTQQHEDNEEEEAKRQQRRSIVITEQEKCIVCQKSVYHSERFSTEGLVYHMACVRCVTCQRKLHMDKFVIVRKQIYCKQHSMAVSMKLAPNITTAAPMPSMSARGGALSMN